MSKRLLSENCECRGGGASLFRVKLLTKKDSWLSRLEPSVPAYRCLIMGDTEFARPLGLPCKDGTLGMLDMPFTGAYAQGVSCPERISKLVS